VRVCVFMIKGNRKKKKKKRIFDSNRFDSAYITMKRVNKRHMRELRELSGAAARVGKKCAKKINNKQQFIV
jgi:methionine synthase I (cobalamin-dependent)